MRQTDRQFKYWMIHVTLVNRDNHELSVLLVAVAQTPL